MTQEDQWSKWLLDTRFGGDLEAAQQGLAQLHAVGDRILKNAAVQSGETLLDIGCGDGLVAFGALERVGSNGQVVFCDISPTLLEHCRGLAKAGGQLARSSFVEASADELRPIDDGSVDVVTTRSVLIYVRAKTAAFREFHRVLRPGGRISLFEPINRFGETYAPNEAWPYGMDQIPDLGERLHDFYRNLQPLDSDPMMDFDQHDLIRLAEAADFANIHLTYHVLVYRSPPMKWEAVITAPGNPNIPSMADAMSQIFSAAERARFESHFRPAAESGGHVVRSAVAYLTARKDGT